MLALGTVGVVGLGLSYLRFGRNEPTTTPATVAEAKTAVHVKVDERATLALVNGTRHDERPLVIQLSSKEEAVVEIVGSNGEMVRRTVKPEDEGVLVALPPAPAPATTSASVRPPAATTLQRAPVKPKATAPLMKNPF